MRNRGIFELLSASQMLGTRAEGPALPDHIHLAVDGCHINIAEFKLSDYDKLKDEQRMKEFPQLPLGA